MNVNKGSPRERSEAILGLRIQKQDRPPFFGRGAKIGAQSENLVNGPVGGFMLTHPKPSEDLVKLGWWKKKVALFGGSFSLVTLRRPFSFTMSQGIRFWWVPRSWA